MLFLRNGEYNQWPNFSLRKGLRIEFVDVQFIKHPKGEGLWVYKKNNLGIRAVGSDWKCVGVDRC